MTIAVGDRIRIREGIHDMDFKTGQTGTVHQLGVKYLGDIRVIFDHDFTKEPLWVYHDEYEKEEVV